MKWEANASYSAKSFREPRVEFGEDLLELQGINKQKIQMWSEIKGKLLTKDR